MKTKDPDIELRQEEIQEILGVIPPWVIRWGSWVLAMVLTGIITGSVWFKYPDRLACNLVLTSNNPPVILNARQSGRIELLATGDSHLVKKGQLLAVVESSAKFSDMLELDSLMEQNQNLSNGDDFSESLASLSENYNLGEWQPSLAAFCKALKDLNDFKMYRSDQSRVNSLIKQQKDYALLWDRQNKQRLIKSEQMKIQERQYQRLISLRDSNSISMMEFESGSSEYLNAKFNLETSGSLLTQTQIEIDKLDHQIIVIEKDFLELRDQKSNLLREAYDQLAGMLANWKLNYTFIAPIDGIVVFTRIWSQNQSVAPGERVMTIISGEPGPVIGKVLLPLKGSGKVRTGQKVILRIDKFPYMEYGSLEGRVVSVSMVSDQEFYSVEIGLPEGLRTTYNKELTFNQGMTGQAEIITAELSLLLRIVNPLRSILNRNKVLAN